MVRKLRRAVVGVFCASLSLFELKTPVSSLLLTNPAKFAIIRAIPSPEGA